MAVSVITLAHTESFKAGMIVKVGSRKMIVTKVVPRAGLQLKPARWYHFLLYKFAHAIAKRNKEPQ